MSNGRWRCAALGGGRNGGVRFIGASFGGDGRTEEQELESGGACWLLDAVVVQKFAGAHLPGVGPAPYADVLFIRRFC